MSDSIDKWHKLLAYPTNMQAELHSNLLKNNGIHVALQALSAIPGMNSGAVLWVQQADLARAQQILASIEVPASTSAVDPALKVELATSPNVNDGLG